MSDQMVENIMAVKRIHDLKVAMEAAQGFIDCAEEAIDRIENDSLVAITGSRETGTAKRASMDLSNALVAVRRS